MGLRASQKVLTTSEAWGPAGEIWGPEAGVYGPGGGVYGPGGAYGLAGRMKVPARRSEGQPGGLSAS